MIRLSFDCKVQPVSIPETRLPTMVEFYQKHQYTKSKLRSSKKSFKIPISCRVTKRVALEKGKLNLCCIRSLYFLYESYFSLYTSVAIYSLRVNHQLAFAVTCYPQLSPRLPEETVLFLHRSVTSVFREIHSSVMLAE